MKKLFTMLLAFAVITVASYGQNVLGTKANEIQHVPNTIIPKLDGNLYNFGTMKNAADKPMLDRFIDTIRDATFSFYGYVSPVVYEPNSNTLIMTQNYRYVPEGQNDLYGSIYIKYSQNNGSTWNERTLWDEPNKVPVWPSIAVTNPNNLTNPANFNYVVVGPVAIREGELYPWKGDYWLLVNGTNSVDALVLDYPIPGQRWFWTRAASNIVNGNEIFYNAGTLANDPGRQYGYYGISAFDMTYGDFNAQGSPAQWGLDRFRPSTELNSSFNDYLYIDSDNDGAVYVGVKNQFANDINKRVPAVSKSVDGGATWSEFDRFPSSLLDNYFNVYGGDPSNSFMIPYSSDGFVVWGKDSYSFLFRTVITKGQDDYEFHIVETFNNNGTWGIRKVADWSGYNMISLSNVGDMVWKDSITVSRLGGELQIARTKDNKHLVAKWIDYIDDTLQINPPVVMNEVNTVDAINCTDVFMAYRDLSSTDWSQTYNVTNDKTIDKSTYIPLIVPALDNIPLFQLMTFRSQYNDPNNPRNQYPMNLWQIMIDTWQGVGFTRVSLSPQMAVKETNYNFSVNDVYPNPASDFAEFTFNLNTPGNVLIEIYNNLGQKVKTLANTNLDAGLHGINIPAYEFISGNYYIRLSNNGNSITKALNIIR